MLGFPDSSVGKESACNAGDLGSIPGLGRRSAGEGNGDPLQYSGLENSKRGYKESTRLSDWVTFTSVILSLFTFLCSHRLQNFFILPNWISIPTEHQLPIPSSIIIILIIA